MSEIVFPEVIAIDEKIEVLRRTLERNPELSERERNGYAGLITDLKEKRQNLLDGLQKRI